MRTSSQTGFTLTELLVSSAIGLFTLAVAVQMASDHTAILSQTTSKMDMYQSARTAVELLGEDLRHAGLGVGYRPDGRFAGLIRGSFQVQGGATFTADGLTQTLSTGSIPTDDLGIRLAMGDLRTIASFSGSQGQICAGSDMEVGDLVVMLSREALHARTVTLQSKSAATCIRGQCRDGCETVTFAPSTAYESDAGAGNANYIEGSMVGDFAEVVWFVVPGADQEGELRRAYVTQADPCNARDDQCGGLVAEDVETLQVAIWQWDDQTSAWVNQTTAGTVGDRRRLRVDVELVVRGGQDEQSGAHRPIELKLDGQKCVGGSCGATGDKWRRFAVRTSVEIRNSGRMLIR